MAERRITRHLPLLVVVIVCLLASANLWLGGGILNTRARGDSPFLLQRTFELVQALRAGDIPARWMPDAAYGLGYPFFTFYAALPYYLAAGLTLLGVDLLTSIKLVQTAGMFLAAGTMWLFARTFLGRAGSTLAVVAYVLAPFHLVNVYVRGDSLSEFYAFVFFPLILWAVDCVADRRPAPRWGWLLLAAALAGLLLTHNVSALLFAPFIAAYALLRWLENRRDQGARRLAQLALAAALGIALSAWFWLPALFESGGVQLDQQTTGYFNYANHFGDSALVQTGLVFDYAARDSDIPMQMGLVQAALIATGTAVWLVTARRRRTPLAFAAFFLAATLMTVSLSALLWEYVPLLKLAQFPWRYLSVQAVFGAVLVGGNATLNRRSWRIAIAAAAAAALSLSALPGLPKERLDIRASDVNPQSLSFYEWFTTNIGTTIRGEYLPRTATPRPWTGPEILGGAGQPLAVSGSARAIRSSGSGLERAWRVQVDGGAARLVFPLLFGPGWQVDIDGAPAVPSAYEGSGWAAVEVAPGDHVVSWRMAHTPLERSAELVSLLAAVLALVVVGWVGRRAPWLRIVGATVLAGALLWVATVVLRTLAESDAGPAPLQSVDFDRRPFPHRAPIEFRDAGGQAYELTAARIEPSTVRAGDAFTLWLEWRDGRAPPNVTVVQKAPSGVAGPRGEQLFIFGRDSSQANASQTVHVALPESIPGPLLLQLGANDAAGAPLGAFVSGAPVAEPLLYGLAVSEPISRQAPTVLRGFDNGVSLHQLDWFPQDSQVLCIRPTWSLDKVTADAWQVSLRLRSADGRSIATVDGQPIAGAAPTWSWRPGNFVKDSYCKVPMITAPVDGEPYIMEIIWYRASDKREVGRASLAGVTNLAPYALNEPR